MSDRSDFQVAIEALKHYSKKLQELKDDEDIKKGNNMMVQDIDANCQMAEDVIKSLETGSRNAFKDNTDIICSGLLFYKRDLEQSKKDLVAKLGEGVYFRWDKMDDEIRQVERIQADWSCSD